MKRVLLGVSGGTAASMGAFAKFFVEEGEKSGYKVYAMPEFWRGIIEGKKPIMLNSKDVENWDKFGGSPFVPSCKNVNVFNYHGQDMSQRVIVNTSEYDHIVIIGGGGTTKQVQELNRLGFEAIVVSATMDNDIPTFYNVLGYETAVEEMGKSIFAAWCDAMTMHRPTVIISMGYDCSAVALGATKRAIELGAKIDCLHINGTSASVKDVAEKFNQSNSDGCYLIVASEGVCPIIQNGTGAHIHKSYDYSAYVSELNRLTNCEFKKVVGDYTQRSGIPFSADVDLAKRFAELTKIIVSSDFKWSCIVGLDKKNEVYATGISGVAQQIRAVENGEEKDKREAYFLNDDLRKIII